MKTGIVICTYNRPEYLEKTFESLLRAEIQQGTKIIIVDDNSTDNKTIELINNFSQLLNGVMPIFKRTGKKGVCDSLVIGFDKLIELDCDVLINLDSDALVRNDFIKVLTELKNKHKENIVTGFHSVNKNKDGSERHPITYNGNGFCKKKSVGGINFCIDQDIYIDTIRPVLVDCLKNGGNWDHKACIESNKKGYEVVCSVPSVVQHIGFDSSMNHNEEPDIASDFKELNLPEVTLIGVDCVDLKRIEYAINKSCENINFASVKILSSIVSNNTNSIVIQRLSTIEEYSRFILKDLHKYIDTKYALIVQHDGYVMNYKAWTDEFLKYDYIGATWWYKDGMNVGNGGFSLRSKKLIDICANDNKISQLHPEDHHIGRTYRKYLESKGIKYAPDTIAKIFSIEGHGGQDNVYNGQFGYHGKVVRFNVDKFEKKQKQTLIINQFRGLGDIIFSMKAIQDLVKEGHKIIWPVESQYVSIQKHFPDITFIDKNYLYINYNKNIEYNLSEDTRVIPLRFADSICKVPYTDCMKSKYIYFKKDWREWKKLKFDRDYEAEKFLYNHLLSQHGIKDGEPYNLINKNFRTEMTGVCDIKPNNSLRSIEVKPIEGFTMIDWGITIERAERIYTVGTSINYLIELLDLKAKEIQLYIRRPDEKDFKNYDYILSGSKPYILNY